MRVLVASDGSKYSSAAVDSVCSRNWPKDSQFMVISVAEPLIAMIDPILAHYESSALEDLKQKHKDFAAAAAEKIRKQFPAAEVLVAVTEGAAADQIVQKAKEWGADFVVLGSHGRHGVEKFLLGSVAEAVVAQAMCSVEIIKLAPEKL